MRRRYLTGLLLFTDELHAVVLVSFGANDQSGYVFRNTDPERCWVIRSQALEAGAELSRHIEHQFKLARSPPGEVGS
jgi:hypothetical protein